MIQIRPIKPREIPEALQQLALKSVRLFVGEKAAIVMNFMIKQDCIGEVELGQRLHFDPPLLRGQLSDLLQEQFIEKRSQLMDICEGKLSEIIYYFVNYKSLSDIIQFKLFKMRQVLVEESKMKNKNGVGVKHPDAFQCTNRKCGGKFNELDARALFQSDKDNYFCFNCHELVTEIKMDATGSDDKLMQFQQFTEPLLKLVEEASKFYIDVKPEPEVIKEVQVSIEPSTSIQQPKSLGQHPKSTSQQPKSPGQQPKSPGQQPKSPGQQPKSPGQQPKSSGQQSKSTSQQLKFSGQSSEFPRVSLVRFDKVAPKSSRPTRIAPKGPSKVKEVNISDTDPSEPEAIDVNIMDMEESDDGGSDYQDEFMSDSDSFSD